MLATPKHMKNLAPVTPFRPRGMRGWPKKVFYFKACDWSVAINQALSLVENYRALVEGYSGEVVKPVDITFTGKRKQADMETLENKSIVVPDEDNNSILNVSKMASQLISPPRKRTRLSDVTSLNMSVKSLRRMSRFMN